MQIINILAEYTCCISTTFNMQLKIVYSVRTKKKYSFVCHGLLSLYLFKESRMVRIVSVLYSGHMYITFLLQLQRLFVSAQNGAPIKYIHFSESYHFTCMRLKFYNYLHSCVHVG